MDEQNEEKYLKAAQLSKAIRCLIRNNDKADMYEDIAKMYKSLGDYKDSADLYAESAKKAAEYRKLAKEDETKAKAADKPAIISEHKTIKKKRILVLLLLVVAIGSTIFLTTKPGRYARASFYEKTGDYEKSYKMFGNLKAYKNSEAKSNECRYEYAEKCLQNNQYEKAKKAYRALGDYRDSEKNLASVEIEILKNTKVGGNILFGEYRWLIAEKKDNKALLVKSLPINGFAYNEKSEAVTWENCSLRAYLNSSFLHETFNDYMIDLISDTNITVPDNTKYGTSGGNSTVDKLFLLNAGQFNQYRDILSNYLRDYWLIAPGNTQSAAQFVSYGEIMDYGYDVTDTNIYIRPALWVTIE